MQILIGVRRSRLQALQQQQFVVVSAVSSLFIITDIIARVAPRARNVLLVLLMHIDNIESIVDL